MTSASYPDDKERLLFLTCVLLGVSACTVPSALLSIDVQDPARLDAFCVNLGSNGARRFGQRFEVSSGEKFPQSLGIRADGRTSVVARVDGLSGGMPIGSTTAQFKFSGRNDDSFVLGLAVCAPRSNPGALQARATAEVPDGARLTALRTGAEASGGAELVALADASGARLTLAGVMLTTLSVPGAGGAVTQLLSHDVDSDCADDLVVASTARAPAIQPSASDGAVTVDPSRIAANVPASLAMAFADLNADHHADLVTIASEGVVVLKAEGSGYSEITDAIDTQPAGARTLAVGDLDGDDSPDALVSVSQGPLYFMRSARNGHLSLATSPVSEMLDASVVLLHDVDGDRDLDAIVVAHMPSVGVRVLLNDSSGSFTGFTDRTADLVPAALAVDASAMMFGDVDGDCRDELLVLPLNGPPLVYDLALSTGILTLRATLGSAIAQSAVIADLDGDGIAEVSLLTGSKVVVWSTTSGSGT